MLFIERGNIYSGIDNSLLLI